MTDLSGLPKPRVPDQKFYAAMCGLLAETTELLRDIRDRLPERTTDGQPVGDSAGEEGGVVELREPATPPPALAAPAKADAAEPADEQAGPVELTEPATPAKKTARKAVKKTAAKGRTSTKETS